MEDTARRAEVCNELHNSAAQNGSAVLHRHPVDGKIQISIKPVNVQHINAP